MQCTRTSVPQQAKSSNRHQWQCASIIRMFFVCGPKSKIGDNTIRMFNILSMPLHKQQQKHRQEVSHSVALLSYRIGKVICEPLLMFALPF